MQWARLEPPNRTENMYALLSCCLNKLGYETTENYIYKLYNYMYAGKFSF